METPSIVRHSSSWPGYGRTPRALIRDPGISRDAKALFAAIEDHATDGFAWPGQKRLASYFGSGVRSVQRWLAELVASGWIVVHVERTDEGKRNIYELMHEPRPPELGGVAPPVTSRGGVTNGAKSSISSAREAEPRAAENPQSSSARVLEAVDDDETSQPQREPDPRHALLLAEILTEAGHGNLEVPASFATVLDRALMRNEADQEDLIHHLWAAVPHLVSARDPLQYLATVLVELRTWDPDL